MIGMKIFVIDKNYMHYHHLNGIVLIVAQVMPQDLVQVRKIIHNLVDRVLLLLIAVVVCIEDIAVVKVQED